MPIYAVELTRTIEVLVGADSPADAENLGIEIADWYEADTFSDVMEIDSVRPSKVIACYDDDYLYSELLELEEWINAIDNPPPDPNQGVMFE